MICHFKHDTFQPTFFVPFITFSTASSAQRSLKKLCCSCWCGNMSKNSRAEQCVHEISGIQSLSTKLVEFRACPLNLWKSMQCVHKISGIRSLLMTLVESKACLPNFWKSLQCYKKFWSSQCVHKIGELYIGQCCAVSVLLQFDIQKAFVLIALNNFRLLTKKSQREFIQTRFSKVQQFLFIGPTNQLFSIVAKRWR